MATVRVFRSTDVSAPVLSGSADALIALLKACLVTGYGSNPSLGWTNPYNDTTNKIAVFTQGAGSMGRSLRINDNGPNATSTFKEARAVGFESITGAYYTDGTAPFPTTTQHSRTGVTGDNTTTTSGLVWRKSATADATARSWILIGNETLFHLFIQTGDSTTLFMAYSFGDIYSYKSIDNYKAYLVGRVLENSVGGTADDFACFEETGASAGNFIVRSYTGAGSSLAFGKHSDTAGVGPCQAFYSSGVGVAYPNPVDGSLLLARTYVHEPTAVAKRGFIPGLWNSLHDCPLVTGDTISGSGGLSGKTFECVQLLVASDTSQVFIETSNTWEVGV